MLWIVLSVLLWGLIHSLFATHKVKELARQVFGPRVNRFYRLAYNVFAGVSFLPVLAVMFLVPDRSLYLVSLPWLGLMVLGELLAVAALVIGFRQTDAWEFLGLRQLGESDKPSKLTTSGLYHYVRHPLYAAGLAFIWLMPLMTFNVLAVNIALTVYVITGAYFEERKLRREFGQDYMDYMAITPMFIPFLKGNKSRRKAS
ncbi:MAG TPA: isoprenylcysteine carboxylmethyltransferase family protein [Anaerolineales bacterium]